MLHKIRIIRTPIIISQWFSHIGNAAKRCMAGRANVEILQIRVEVKVKITIRVRFNIRILGLGFRVIISLDFRAWVAGVVI